MADRRHPLLAPGNEAEWARINEEEAGQAAEFAASLTIPERLEFGQGLCDRRRGAELLYVVIGEFAVIAHTCGWTGGTG